MTHEEMLLRLREDVAAASPTHCFHSSFTRGCAICEVQKPAREAHARLAALPGPELVEALAAAVEADGTDAPRLGWYSDAVAALDRCATALEVP